MKGLISASVCLSFCPSFRSSLLRNVSVSLFASGCSLGVLQPLSFCVSPRFPGFERPLVKKNETSSSSSSYRQEPKLLDSQFDERFEQRYFPDKKNRVRRVRSKNVFELFLSAGGLNAKTKLRSHRF